MNKYKSIFFLPLIIVGLTLLTFCNKKQDLPVTDSKTTVPSSTATPSATLNPLANSTEVTDFTLTNPCTQSSTLQVGTTLPGWTFAGCLTSSLTLTGTDGTSTVILTFGSVILTGSYTLTSGVPLPGQVRMTVIDAPGQPTGILWYSKNGGTVSVVVGASTTVAAFTSVQCTQPLFPLPIVTVSGDVGCQ